MRKGWKAAKQIRPEMVAFGFLLLCVAQIGFALLMAFFRAKFTR